MSTTGQKRSAISRLLDLVNQPRHDYSPSTDIFLELNVDRIAQELQLASIGTERGTAELPAQDALTLDDVEHRIIERVERHKLDAHKLYLEHLHTYDARLAALDFEERFAVVRQAAPEAVGDFRAEAALGRDELFALRRRVNDSEKEREHFRAVNKLIRPARVPTLGKTLLKIGILALLFVIEVVVNGRFLAEANLGGYLGGAVQAVVFAALNIIASFLWGLVPIRLLNCRKVFLRFLGVVALVAFFAFAIGLNLTLAHLREIPPSISGNVGQEVQAQLMRAPHVLKDVISWVFFAVGFIFSLIAMADGLVFTDPYPGYASLEKRWLEASQKYREGKAELIERLRDIRQDATEAMKAAGHDFSVRRGEFDRILQGRSRLAQRFLEHQNHIGRAGNALLAVYREANRQARRSPAPGYFAKAYEIERIVDPSDGKEETARDKLRQSIVASQAVLQTQIQAILECFEEEVRSYREIDELIPEDKRG